MADVVLVALDEASRMRCAQRANPPDRRRWPMPAAPSATLARGAWRLARRPRGPRAPETRQRDLSRRVSSPSPHRRRGASRPALGEPARRSRRCRRTSTWTRPSCSPGSRSRRTPPRRARATRTCAVARPRTSATSRATSSPAFWKCAIRADLPRGRAGASDPYVVLSVGGATTATAKAPEEQRSDVHEEKHAEPEVERRRRRAMRGARAATRESRRSPWTSTMGPFTRQERRLFGHRDRVFRGPRRRRDRVYAAGVPSRRRECLGARFRAGRRRRVDFSLTFTPLTRRRGVVSAGLKRTAALLRRREERRERRRAANENVGSNRTEPAGWNGRGSSDKKERGFRGARGERRRAGSGATTGRARG